MWWKFTSGCSDMPLCFSQWRIFLLNVIDCNLIPCASWYSCALATTEPSGCSNGSWAKSEVETRPVQQFSWKSCSQPQLESELSDSTDVVVQRTSTDLHPANQVTLHRTRSERISGWYWMFCFHAFLSCSESRKRYMSVDEKDTTCPLIDRSMRTNTWPSAVLSRVRRTLLIVQQDRC